MNKRHGMIAVALVALLLITGCSTFFTGGVSGKVKYNGEPVARATVALYFDEGQRNADLAAKNKVFHTEYKTETQENGSFAITNIPWDSAFPEYGKDADTKTAYALVYHKDYGYLPIDGITIISGRSNEFFPEFPEKETKTLTVTVNFKQAVNNRGSHGITEFKYSYANHPGYNAGIEFEGTATVSANGTAKLNIEYKDNIPAIRIHDIIAVDYDEAGKPYTVTVNGDLKKQESYVFTSEQVATKVLTIKTVPYKYRFPGFNGIVTGLSVEEYKTAVPVVLNINHDGFEAEDTKNTEPSSDRFEKNDRFTGLGNNIILVNEPDPNDVYKAVIEVPCTIKLDMDGAKAKNLTMSSDETISREISIKKVN